MSFGEPDIDGNYFNPDYLVVERVYASRDNERDDYDPEAVSDDNDESEQHQDESVNQAEGSEKASGEDMEVETGEKVFKVIEKKQLRTKNKVKSMFSDDTEYLVKWAGLPYEESTWQVSIALYISHDNTLEHNFWSLLIV